MRRTLFLIFLFFSSLCYSQTNKFERREDTLIVEFNTPVVTSYILVDMADFIIWDLYHRSELVDSIMNSLISSKDNKNSAYPQIFWGKGIFFEKKIKNFSLYVDSPNHFPNDIYIRLTLQNKKDFKYVDELLKKTMINVPKNIPDTIILDVYQEGLYDVTYLIDSLVKVFRLDTIPSVVNGNRGYATFSIGKSGAIEKIILVNRTLGTISINPKSYVRLPILALNGSIKPYKIIINEWLFSSYRNRLMFRNFSTRALNNAACYIGYDSTSQFYFLGGIHSTAYNDIIMFDTTNRVIDLITAENNLINPVEYRFFGRDTLPYYAFIEHKKGNDTILDMFYGCGTIPFVRNKWNDYRRINDNIIYKETVDSITGTKQVYLYKYYFDLFRLLDPDKAKPILDTLDLAKYR